MDSGKTSLVVSRKGDTETIAVSGELEAAMAGRLTEAIMEAEAGSAERIIVDLGEVTAIDRPSLAVLWRARTRQEHWNGGLVFLRPDAEAVRQFIDRVRMDELLCGDGPV